MRNRSDIPTIVLVATLVGLFIGFAGALSCESWTFDEDIDSPSGLGKVSGLGFKYHPRNPSTDEIDFNTYLAWRIGDFEETQPGPPMWHKCDIETGYPSTIGAPVFRRMRVSDLDCNYIRGDRILENGVNQTFIQVNATWPIYPDFYLLFEVQTVNDTIERNYGSGLHTDGLEYHVKHNAMDIKSVFKVVNWPWGATNGTSFLMTNFLGAAQSSDFNATIRANVTQQGTMLTMEAERFILKQNMTHFVLLDGEPVLKTFADSIYDEKTLYSETQVSFFFPFGICREHEEGLLPQFSVLDYDPQFASLFTGDSTSPSAPLATPAKKAENRAVAIAAGTTVGLAAVAVAGALAYFFLVYRPAKMQTPAWKQKKSTASGTSSAEAQQ